MGKIKNPVTISSAFGISEGKLIELGIVDVLLDTDTLLFIDPLLLSESRHSEIRLEAVCSYNDRFEKIIKLLAICKNKGDVPWRNAERLFKFSEISWTCLGYGTSVKGSGFGKNLIASTLDTAWQIVQLGVDDVDLFMALALFEEGIGPDRISDMTTNIILHDLIAFSQRINIDLMLPTKIFKVFGKNLELICNPCSENPLILVPQDIVRALPLAADWSEISHVVAENEDLRGRLNEKIGQIWANMTKAKKNAMKTAALKSKDAFDPVLEIIKKAEPTPYDFSKDKNGEVFWTTLLARIAREFPFDLSGYAERALDINEVETVVKEILMQFRDLVENKGQWKELWADDGKPRKEKASQRLFYAIAYSYCKANGLDLTPEADNGNGPVDFKVSKGFNSKVVVEIKLSTNPDVIHGYEKQLEIYKRADDTDRGVFLLVDVGKMGKKYTEVQRIRAQFLKNHGHASDIVYVDGTQKASASKRE